MNKETVSLDESRSLVNEEYYWFLLWSDIPILWDYTTASKINTWIFEGNEGQNAEYQNLENFELMQGQLFGNEGRTADHYEKFWEYRKNGKTDFYKSQGIIDWLGEEDVSFRRW